MEPEISLPPLKRRKVRKGTHTCWECKRRKVRCIFAAPGDAVCTGCAKRCLRCVSQEFPEEMTSPAAKSRLVGERIVRVEQMIRQLTQATQGPGSQGPGSQGSSTPSSHLTSQSTPSSHLTPVSSVSQGTPASSTPSPDPFWTPSASLSDQHLQKLSDALLAVYPSQPDLDLIAAVSTKTYRICQNIFRSEREIRRDGFWDTAALCARPPPQTHPVHMAGQMLMLALLLQMSAPGDVGGLSEPYRVVKDRLADTAITLVSRNDELLDTIEGLMCIMLEAVYRGNTGHLRRAWLTWRRALSLGQLMCLPRQAMQAQKGQNGQATLLALQCPGHEVDPQFLWYRLLSTDRFMCLLLGLEQTAIDLPLLPADVLGCDTPMGRLEYELSHIAAYILGRNEHGPQPDDYATTQRIDRKMQELAATLPSRWWLPPNLAAEVADGEEVWEMMRFKLHVFYYNLLNQLHLPYMMRPAAARAATHEDQRRREYSRIACVSASREVLGRYISLRSFNQIAHCCRFAEFFALMASLTLLLVHIDGHRSGADGADGADAATANLLAHQRLSDRAMTEETLESMERVGHLNEQDAVCETSVDLLRQLLAIEADAATSGTSHLLASCPDDVRSAGELRLAVPYVGVITINRNGAIHKEAYGQALRHTLAQIHADSRPPVQPVQSVQSTQSVQSDQSAQSAPAQTEPQTTDAAHSAQPFDCYIPCLGEGLPEIPLTTPQPAISLQPGPPISLQTTHPGPTAGIDQWAFQGVDMAFFDSLMRESAMDPQGNGWM